MGVQWGRISLVELPPAPGFAGRGFFWQLALPDRAPPVWAWLPKFDDNGDIAVIPLWIPFLLIVTPTAWFWARDRRLARHVCPCCHYDLTGSPPGACPECGAGTSANPP